jgi:hypothetical protein
VRFMLLMVVAWAWAWGSAVWPAPDHAQATGARRSQAQIDAYVISSGMDSARIRAALSARVVQPPLNQ